MVPYLLNLVCHLETPFVYDIGVETMLEVATRAVASYQRCCDRIGSRASAMLCLASPDHVAWRHPSHYSVSFQTVCALSGSDIQQIWSAPGRRFREVRVCDVYAVLPNCRGQLKSTDKRRVLSLALALRVALLLSSLDPSCPDNHITWLA